MKYAESEVIVADELLFRELVKILSKVIDLQSRMCGTKNNYTDCG